MPRSTADLVNWRTMPEPGDPSRLLYRPASDQGTADLFNQQRGATWGAMGAINKMPFMFDPSKWWQPGIGLGRTPEEQQAVIDAIRNAIKPGSGAPGGGLLSMLGPETITGLLASLGVNK